MLYSNSRILPANLEADSALRAAVTGSASQRLEFYDEYLDVPRFGGDAYVGTVARYLREKYAQQPPAAIVTGGNDALAFVVSHRAKLFPGVPVVFLGATPEFVHTLGPLTADVVGVLVEYDYVGTIELALRWHPQATRLVLVTGANAKDRFSEARSRREFGRFEPRVKLEFLAGLPTSDLQQRLHSLGRESVVFTPGFFEDGAGRRYLPREAAELVAAASPAPVYAPFDTFIGTGIVGGRMPSYAAIGTRGGAIVNALLGGAAPASLQPPSLAETRPNVDWRQARRFGIPESAFPADTVVHFKQPTFWEAYRNIVLGGATVILVQAALIGALLLERRRRRLTATALATSERNMSLAARAAQLSTWDWAESDRLLAAADPADRAHVERSALEAIADGRELNLEYRVLGSAGEVRWLAVSARPADGERGRLLGVARDVTDRKLADLQSARDRSALQHMARVSTLGQLSASIAHQLNQPLAAILGNAEAARALLDREPVDLSELRDICGDIVTENHRAAEVIRRLGALFRRGEPERKPLDVNELVLETLELARTDLLMRHVNASADLTPGVPVIEGDRVQLQQVLLNLVVNAADAMSEAPEKERELVVHSEQKGAYIHIRVTDRGPGIAAENLPRIFDPFWSSKMGGMGIGLAICRSIAEAHGGSLTATNRPGGGAEFCLALSACEMS